MTLKKQIFNGVSPPGHTCHYFKGKYTHPFCMKMKKITAGIRRILRQSYLSYCHYQPGKSPPSWGPTDSSPLRSLWFLLVASNRLQVREPSHSLPLEPKFISVVYWGSSFSPWIPRSWLHHIVFKISGPLSLIFLSSAASRTFKIGRILLCWTSNHSRLWGLPNGLISFVSPGPEFFAHFST